MGVKRARRSDLWGAMGLGGDRGAWGEGVSLEVRDVGWNGAPPLAEMRGAAPGSG